jgi:biotin carboxylase
LVATIDRELVWLGEHRQEFEPACKVLVQTPESLFRIQSKRYQLEVARQAGLPILPTYRLSRPEDADFVPALDFPLVLRPDRPEDVWPGFKVRLVESPDQLRDALRRCHRILSPILAQPFRPLPNLVVHGARSVDGDVIASRCYIVPRKFEGVTLTLEERRFPDGLEERCRQFASLASITGCYHFEFLFSAAENRAYFLEVNVRLGGTTDKVVRTGFDEPSLLLQSYGIPLTHRSAPVPGRRVADKRMLLKHIVWAAKGKLTPLDYPDVGRLRHIAHSCRDLIVAKDSIFAWRDVRGSMRFHLRTWVQSGRGDNGPPE